MRYNRLRLLVYFLKGSKRWFGLSVIFTCLVTFCDMLGPKIIEYAFDHILSDSVAEPTGFMAFMSGITDDFMVIALIIAVIALFGALFRYLFKLFDSLGAETLVKRMREQLFSHILKLPYSWYGENKTGDIIQRCTSDVETVKSFLSQQLTELFRTVILIVFSMFFMFRISIPLSLVAAAFIPVVLTYSLVFYYKIGKTFLEADEREGRLSAMCQENLTGVRVVRAFGRERFEQDRFEKFNDSYTAMWVRLMRILSVYWSVGDIFTGLQLLLCISLGAVSCVNGNMTAGEFVAFISYNGMLIWPVRQMGRVIADMSKAGVSIDRIMYIMNSPMEEERDIGWRPADGEKNAVSVKNVSFSYPGASEPVLKDISFDLEKGKTLGILGSTGSGKSTLAALICGLYPLDEKNGRIEVFGQDIQKLSGETLRDHIGMALQETYLFSGTLHENLTIAAESADGPAVAAAIQTACLDDTIHSFRKGYATKVGEKGVTLSGGQKQRTAIAQILIKDTEIMIFDDSLSAVDAATDLKIRQAMKNDVKGKTAIYISHRTATLMSADEIIVMDKGRIVERGNHAALMQKNGMYKRIYELQTV